MRHALIEDGKVVNIIEIDPRNASDFKDAVTIPDGVGAGIGDSYRDGRFYRYNEETEQEEEILPYDPMAGVYEQMQVTANTAMQPMMLAMGDVMQIHCDGEEFSRSGRWVECEILPGALRLYKPAGR